MKQLVPLVSATSLTAVYRLLWNFACVFFMVWGGACGLDVIVRLFFYFLFIYFFIIFIFIFFFFFFFFFFFYFFFSHCELSHFLRSRLVSEKMLCWCNSSYSFLPIIFKLCIFVLHDLKMCVWFCGYPPIIFYQLFTLYTYFFPGPISIGVDTLWAQLLLEFYTNHFKTMHICATWSEDVRVVSRLSSYHKKAQPFTDKAMTSETLARNELLLDNDWSWYVDYLVTGFWWNFMQNLQSYGPLHLWARWPYQQDISKSILARVVKSNMQVWNDLKITWLNFGWWGSMWLIQSSSSLQFWPFWLYQQDKKKSI